MGRAHLSTHDHVCAFVRGDDERERVALSFFVEGLQAGEACRYVGRLRDGRRLAAVMSEDGVDVRLFEVSRPWDPVTGDPLDVDRLIHAADVWAGTIAALDGHHFTRTITDMTALHPRIGSVGLRPRLVDYEARATKRAKAFPHVDVCMFDFGVFGGDVVIASTKTHPDVWMGGYVLARLPTEPPE
nr:MEDS domain-containing protein [Pseudonocardia acidicola]